MQRSVQTIGLHIGTATIEKKQSDDSHMALIGCLMKWCVTKETNTLFKLLYISYALKVLADGTDVALATQIV